VKVLFDHNLPRRLREHLPEHEIRTAREIRWEQLRIGALLSAASEARFEVFVTIDKQLEHQWNLRALPPPIVIVDGTSELPALC
jgi:predicted nuclease of predicted toxin-antitoxin system